MKLTVLGAAAQFGWVYFLWTSAGSCVHCCRKGQCGYTLATRSASIRGFGGWQLNKAGLSSIYRSPKSLFGRNKDGLVD